MAMRQRWRWESAWLAALVCLTMPWSRAEEDDDEPDPPRPITIELTMEPTILDMEHLKASRMGYMPGKFSLVPDRPAGITKEPDYRGTPSYGCFRIGNGPKNLTLFAVDEPEGDASLIYVDRNQNGDLTDDGPGSWDHTRDIDGVNNYMTIVPVHASWGDPLVEQEGADYHLFVYKRHGAAGGGYAKISGRAGQLPVGETTYHVVMAESTNDGLFTVPALGDLTRRPTEVYVDLDADGTFRGVTTEVDGKEFRSPERFNLAEPFQIDGQWYLGRPSISGRSLTLLPTSAPGTDVLRGQAPVEVKRVLEVGTTAPDFVVEMVDGTPFSLKALKGKVVILDFWATWCGPCQASMPGLERVYRAVRDKGVEVVSLNVFDDRDAFQEWIKANSGSKYTFTFAYDPAEKTDPKSVARGLYNVPGLPTMYVIDREGKVAAVLVGGGQEEKLLEALAAIGIEATLPEGAEPAE